MSFYLFQRFGVVRTDTPHKVLAKARELLIEVKNYLQDIHANGVSLLGFSSSVATQFRVLLTTFISLIKIFMERNRFNSTTRPTTGTSPPTTGPTPDHVLEDLNTNLREFDEYLTRIRKLDIVMESMPGFERILQQTYQASVRSTTQLPSGTPVGLTLPTQDTTTTNSPVGTNTDSHMDRLTGTYSLENNASTNIRPEDEYTARHGGKRRKTRGRRSRKTRGRRSRMNRNKNKK